MNGRIVLLALLVTVVIPLATMAQQQDSELTTREEWVANYNKFGIAATVSLPYGDFSEDRTTGYGLQGLVDFPLVPLFNLTGTVGWSHFPEDGDVEPVDIWYVNIGGRLVLASFYMSGQTGYYSELDQWGWVPGFGFRFTQLELGLEYVGASKGAWTTLRVGWYF